MGRPNYNGQVVLVGQICVPVYAVLKQDFNTITIPCDFLDTLQAVVTAAKAPWIRRISLKSQQWMRWRCADSAHITDSAKCSVWLKALAGAGMECCSVHAVCTHAHKCSQKDGRD